MKAVFLSVDARGRRACLDAPSTMPVRPEPPVVPQPGDLARMLTALSDDEVGAFVTSAAAASGLRGTPIEAVVSEQQRLLRGLLGGMSGEEVQRLHRAVRRADDLMKIPGAVKRAHTPGLNFDGDGSDPAAAAVIAAQQEILTGYARERGDAARALKEARAEAWEAKAALRLAEEETVGVSIALAAAEERCEAVRAEMDALKTQTQTITPTAASETAVQLYDAAVASGELVSEGGDGDDGESAGGTGGALLERARERADAIVADAEELARRLLEEAERARGGWEAQVRAAAEEMHRSTAADLARARAEAVAEGAREAEHARAQIATMNGVIEARVEEMTAPVLAEVERLKGQLAKRREDNEAIASERDALLAETKALAYQAQTMRGEHAAALAAVREKYEATTSAALRETEEHRAAATSIRERLIAVTAARDDADKALAVLRVAAGLGIPGIEEYTTVSILDRPAMTLEEEAERLRVMARQEPERTKAAVAAALEMVGKESARRDAEKLERVVDAELAAERVEAEARRSVADIQERLDEALVRAKNQNDRADAAEASLRESKAEATKLKRQLEETLQDVDAAAAKVKAHADEVTIAKEATRAAKAAADNARAERTVALSQLQTFRESAAAKFSTDTAAVSAREKASAEEIARLKEQVSALKGEADARVLAERSRVAALMSETRASAEAEAKSTMRETLEAMRDELAAARGELNRERAERDRLIEGVRTAAMEERERMIDRHAAELEQCAGSAGTEVLRLTEALDRARKDAASAVKARDEAAVTSDRDKAEMARAASSEAAGLRVELAEAREALAAARVDLAREHDELVATQRANASLSQRFTAAAEAAEATELELRVEKNAVAASAAEATAVATEAAAAKAREQAELTWRAEMKALREKAEKAEAAKEAAIVANRTLKAELEGARASAAAERAAAEAASRAATRTRDEAEAMLARGAGKDATSAGDPPGGEAASSAAAPWTAAAAEEARRSAAATKAACDIEAASMRAAVAAAERAAAEANERAEAALADAAAERERAASLESAAERGAEASRKFASLEETLRAERAEAAKAAERHRIQLDAAEKNERRTAQVREHYEAANGALRAQLDEARAKATDAAAAAAVANAVVVDTWRGEVAGARGATSEALDAATAAAMERARVAEERVKLLEARLGGVGGGGGKQGETAETETPQRGIPGGALGFRKWLTTADVDEANQVELTRLRDRVAQLEDESRFARESAASQISHLMQQVHVSNQRAAAATRAGASKSWFF